MAGFYPPRLAHNTFISIRHLDEGTEAGLVSGEKMPLVGHCADRAGREGLLRPSLNGTREETKGFFVGGDLHLLDAIGAVSSERRKQFSLVRGEGNNGVLP